MRTRPIHAAALISFAMLITVNAAMVPWSARLPWRRKLNAIQKVKDPDVIFVGDSLLDTRIEAVALNQGAAVHGQSFVPVNSALVGSLPPDQALLVNCATTAHPHMKMMVVGVMDFLTTNDVRLRPRDLTGNHEIGVSSQFPVAMVSEVNQWGWSERMQLRVLRLLPILANRRNAWQYIEKLRRAMAQIGMPPEATNQFGRVADMLAQEATSVEEFDEHVREFLANPHFNPSYDAIFATAQQKQMKVVIVIMPMSLSHRERFYSRTSWQQYLGKLRELAAQRGFVVIDASEWMLNQSNFIDHVHLSSSAGSIFSDEIGEHLALLKSEGY